MINEEKIWLIDFQDARLGPVSYDLVSLCFDSYLNISVQEKIQLFNLALITLEKTFSSRFIFEIKKTWKLVLLQRTLKAIGSFCYLSKSKGNYLKYIAPAAQALIELDLYDQRWPILTKKLPMRIYNDKHHQKT